MHLHLTRAQLVHALQPTFRRDTEDWRSSGSTGMLINARGVLCVQQ
ncbi:hypothetical protein SUNI508_14111 [Seiridium unicorne]|uniref:Uncharacterized protein n=1 Tax=Seiridium unicorne TaxID=138068 RepID=A0ABR2UXU7_9PEZI